MGPTDRRPEGPIKILLAQDMLAFLGHDEILDIWDGQYIDKFFRKTPPKDTYVFAATLRLKTDAAQEILPISGKDGEFSEPRTDNGRSPDPMYRVIWLPRKTFAEAALINQTTQQKSWLVRNGDRLGIRVHEADASEVHAAHRPEISYLDGTSVMSYKVGPFPWEQPKPACRMCSTNGNGQRVQHNLKAKQGKGSFGQPKQLSIQHIGSSQWHTVMCEFLKMMPSKLPGHKKKAQSSHPQRP